MLDKIKAKSSCNLLKINPIPVRALIVGLPAMSKRELCSYNQLFLYAYSNGESVIFDERECAVTAGKLYYVPPATPVLIKTGDKPIDFAHICFNLVNDLRFKYELFSPKIVDKEILTEGRIIFEKYGEMPSDIGLSDYIGAEDIITQICTSEFMSNPYNSLKIRGIFLQLFDFIHDYLSLRYDNAERADLSYEHRQVIAAAKKNIDKNISIPDLTLQEIAKSSSSYSPPYFCSIFKRGTGRSPIDYLLERRIDRAKLLLRMDWQKTVSEIAYLAGFNHEKYFLRVFKKRVGMTPGQYKKNA